MGAVDAKVGRTDAHCRCLITDTGAGSEGSVEQRSKEARGADQAESGGGDHKDSTGSERSECEQLIHFPLCHSLNSATAVLGKPLVNVLGGGGAPLVGSADPSLPRHKGSNGGRVGDQYTSAIGKLHFGHVAADLLDDHRGLSELRSV